MHTDGDPLQGGCPRGGQGQGQAQQHHMVRRWETTWFSKIRIQDVLISRLTFEYFEVLRVSAAGGSALPLSSYPAAAGAARHSRRPL